MRRPAEINVMLRAAHAAGRGLARDFGEVENLQVSEKGPGDFVSVADRQAERRIVEELERARHVHAEGLCKYIILDAANQPYIALDNEKKI